jgi:hypothetical protein
MSPLTILFFQFKIPFAAETLQNYIKQSIWEDSKDYIFSININNIEDNILKICENNSLPLDEFVDISLGLTPYDKYKGHTKKQIDDQVYHSNFQKDNSFKKLLAGNDVRRYYLEWNKNKWISYGPWLGAPREQRFFTEERILIKQIIDWTSKRIWASITDDELYNTQNAFNLIPKSDHCIRYILGILNSKLMTFYHKKKFLDENKMRFQKILIKDCRQLPIRTIDFSSPADVARHDRMVSLVDAMLALNRHLAAAQTAHDKTAIQRQIDATDNQIDRLVYELYGLNNEEIKMIERVDEDQ